MTDIPIIEAEIEPIKPDTVLYLQQIFLMPSTSKKVLAVDIGKKNRVCIFERR